MDLTVKIKDIVNEQNGQEFKVNQSKDEMSECESGSDSISCDGSE
jgi:hypothetical protein